MKIGVWTVGLLAVIAGTLAIDVATRSADAVMPANEANAVSGRFSGEMGIAAQQDTAVVAVVDSATGQVRACWFGGPGSKPECSDWSN